MNETVWTQERQKLARAEARRFAGTPHRNRMCVAGAGVDCIHFVMAVLTAAGVIPQPRLPAYDERIGALRERNIIEDILLDHLHARTVSDPEFGDLVVCRCGRQSNHIGIVMDAHLWHSPGKGYCGPEALANWLPRVQSFVRIEATGLRADPGELTARGILAFAPPPPTA